MIELELDEEHTVDDTRLTALIGEQEGTIANTYFLHPMAFSDGSLAIRASVYFEGEAKKKKEKEVVQFEIADGDIRILDLSEHTIGRDAPRSALNNWASIPFGNDILYLQDTTQAFVVLRSENTVRELRISQPIEDVRINETQTRHLVPSRYAHPSSEGNMAMVALEDGSAAKYLATLVFDPQTLSAHWQAFPQMADHKAAGRSLMSRLFGTSHSKPDVRVAPIMLCAEDFAHTHGYRTDAPLFNQALLRNGKVHVYTKGTRSSPKYGYHCSDIAEIGADGRVISKLMTNDYCNVDDEKKRGLEGHFSSSGRYCMIHSVYQSTDPWKGQQKLLDMDSGEFNDIRLPRGYTKFRIIDHAGDYFWAEPQDWNLRRYARFRAV